MPKRKHSQSTSTTSDDSPDDAPRSKRPSLSHVSYDSVRESIRSLPADPNDIDIKPGHIYRLPEAIHTRLYQAAWKAITVYGDRNIPVDNEARRVRILEAYIVPIVGLFEGRLTDKPGSKLGNSSVSSGGHVEHEIFIIGGMLLIVVEVKKDALRPKHIAQLLAELLAAAVKNGKIHGFENLPVRGILTNATSFKFYTYNPATQSFSQEQPVESGVERRAFLEEMIPITNRVFSIIFTSYMEALSCTVESSTRRGKDGDFESPGSAMLSQLSRTKYPSDDKEILVASKKTLRAPTSRASPSRASTSHWERAYQLAKEAEAQFRESGDDFDARDLNYTKAVGLLRLR